MLLDGGYSWAQEHGVLLKSAARTTDAAKHPTSQSRRQIATPWYDPVAREDQEDTSGKFIIPNLFYAGRNSNSSPQKTPKPSMGPKGLGQEHREHLIYSTKCHIVLTCTKKLYIKRGMAKGTWPLDQLVLSYTVALQSTELIEQ